MGDGGPAAITPAVYQTTLAFLAFDAPSVRLFLQLENRTSARALELEYVGWLWDGQGWTQVLDVRESADVPRAAWRVLPVGPLRLRVTEGEELAGLSLDGEAGGLRVQIRDELAEWASVTGQREFLARAAVEAQGNEQSGILLTSQTARLAGAASRGGERALLVADTLGSALVVFRSGIGNAPVIVHTLLDQQSRRWDGAELAAAEDSASGGETVTSPALEAAGTALDAILAGAPGNPAVERYALRIPGAGIEGIIAVQVPDSTSPEPSALLPAVFSAVTLGDTTLSMSGFQVPLGPNRDEGLAP